MAPDRLHSLLADAREVQGCFLAPEIPRDKLANARAAAWVPLSEEIEAMVDFTTFGSAKKAALFGRHGIYFATGLDDGYLPYSEFPDVVFELGIDGAISYDLGRIDPPAAFRVSQLLVSLLGSLREEAITLEHSSSTEGGGGLAALAGMQELKQLLMEDVVDVVRQPEKFKRYGIEIPNGMLMYGPPGCGKTYIARRLAAELGCTFIEASPSTVASSYVHGSTAIIKELFTRAAHRSPALLFVDEFEGMVPARQSLGGEQQYKAEEVNEWLVQIGSCTARGILFVAATNEPWSIDPAVQRSGRLDKKIYVGPPDGEAIEEMLLYHLRGRPTTAVSGIRSFARTLAGRGYAASDLKLLADEASKAAMKSGEEISPEHLAASAASRVPPSITRESEAAYRRFQKGAATMA